MLDLSKLTTDPSTRKILLLLGTIVIGVTIQHKLYGIKLAKAKLKKYKE